MIAVIGDSWGCGEWNFVQEKVQIVHAGLEQHLKDDGYTVVNLSRGGNQNFESVDALEKYLETATLIPTTVFWFVTCPLRHPGGTIYNNPREFGIQQLKIVFDYADYLAEKYNLTIYALGGLCDIPAEITQLPFNKIKIAIPSIGAITVPDFPKSMFGEIKEIHHIKIKESALDIAVEIEKKMDAFRNAKNWFPDFGHPNREVHYAIFEKIKQYLL